MLVKRNNFLTIASAATAVAGVEVETGRLAI
jgi:hypothetical protein